MHKTGAESRFSGEIQQFSVRCLTDKKVSSGSSDSTFVTSGNPDGKSAGKAGRKGLHRQR